MEKETNLGALKPIVTLDSEIERIFYDRCCKNSVYSNILIDWINNKPIYIEYTQMIEKNYGNYSRHDQSHSVAILESIYAIIGEDRIVKVDIMDLWLLLNCAYAHDIGMPYTYDEAKKFWESVNDSSSNFRKFLEQCLDSSTDIDAKRAAEYIISAAKQMGLEIGAMSNKYRGNGLIPKTENIWPVKIGRYCEYLTSEYCRKNHTNRSMEFMERKSNNITYNTPYVLSARFYKIIAKCSMVHGEDFEAVMKLDEDEWAKESKCHPAFVAALLRIGDLLDIDNNRFDSIVLEHYGKLPEISAIHKQKHDAVTHINLAEDKIEVTARSDSIEVCKCISSWFHYIEKEVRDLIFAWGEIAPKEMQGCKLTLPILKIFYNNQEFSNYESQEFNINKEMLISLVIGRNLYVSNLDFIREYLQNSIDALKMKFWMDIEEGFLDVEIKKDILKKLKNNKSQLGPLDFQHSAFLRYGIDIYCKLVEEAETAYIEVSICDRGIGIDEECLKAISNIGSGWKKREKYKKYLADMPLWLRPTGGFGIGMQSGFMVADEIEIITKCENEALGRKITLHSTAGSGKIEEQRYEVRHAGTKITIKVPYEQFMDKCEYKNQKLLKDNSYGDFFDTNQIMEGVTKIIHNYVLYVAQSSLFPIFVRRIGFEPKEIPQKFRHDAELFDEVIIESSHYQIYREGEIIYLWRVEDGILCTLDENGEKEISWYYKGIRVCDGDILEVAYFLNGLSSIAIDIMGIEVSECLTVDRSRFLTKFDYEKLLCDFISAYFNSYKVVDYWLQNNKEKFKEKAKNYYCMIFAFIYTQEEEIRKKLKEEWDCLKDLGSNPDIIGIPLKTIMKPGLPEPDTSETGKVQETLEGQQNDSLLFKATDLKKNGEEKVKAEWGITSLYEICEQLWEGEEIYIVKNVKMLENMIEDYLNNNSILELEGKKLILSAELYECFKHFYINDIKFVYKSEMSKDNVKCSLEILKYCGNQGKIKDTDNEKLLKSDISSSDSHAIYWSSDSFIELQVKELPWGYQVKEPADVSGNEKRHMVISPIRPMYAEEELLKPILKDKEEPFSEFKKFVMENKNFSYLINWVYNHQVIENKYSKETIRKRYEEFLKEWFEGRIKK